MSPQEVRIGMQVRVGEPHRIEERRGMFGRVIGRYGGENYVAVDVLFPNREYRMFWPGDLEEVASPQRWWRFLLRASRAQ
jgi:hypothetical protein